MAVWVSRRWEASLEARGRANQRGGQYRAYVPDPLLERPLALDRELERRTAAVERHVRTVSSGPGASSLEGLARFLLRSEAMASSQIEGLRVSAKQVALAELAEGAGLDRAAFTENARLVANNITVLREAATSLANIENVTVDAVRALHQALLPDERLHGLRRVQNWVGGSDWHPLDTEFVPPPPGDVAELMDDLVAYVDTAVHAPLVQAALVHAQFETIHPFADGNGRVGRALIHTVLTRRGLTPSAVLPVSLVLLTRRQEYVDALNAYRYTGDADRDEARRAVGRWVAMFLDATDLAVTQAREFSRQLADLREDWERRLSDLRSGKGVRGRPRADAGVSRLLDRLPEVPVMTVATVSDVLEISDVQARKALEELNSAGIVSRQRLDRQTTGYLATEIFDLLTFTERALASTRFDTRESPPARPSPAAPVAGPAMNRDARG